MKVVLRRDIEGIGVAGQILDVADGYARNHLIPRDLAIPASKGVVKQAEEMLRASQARAIKSREQAEAFGQQLTAQPIVVAAQAGSEGQLYGSISNTEIADAITELTGQVVDKRDLKIETPIKTLGTHEVQAQMHAEVEVTFNIEVVASE